MSQLCLTSHLLEVMNWWSQQKQQLCLEVIFLSVLISLSESISIPVSFICFNRYFKSLCLVLILKESPPCFKTFSTMKIKKVILLLDCFICASVCDPGPSPGETWPWRMSCPLSPVPFQEPNLGNLGKMGTCPRTDRQCLSHRHSTDL